MSPPTFSNTSCTKRPHANHVWHGALHKRLQKIPKHRKDISKNRNKIQAHLETCLSVHSDLGFRCYLLPISNCSKSHYQQEAALHIKGELVEKCLGQFPCPHAETKSQGSNVSTHLGPREVMGVLLESRALCLKNEVSPRQTLSPAQDCILHVDGRSAKHVPEGVTQNRVSGRKSFPPP